uniref:Uncharacterized protein n=1 Tax=Oryza rufipogon TaxID=4529 RepID=A0A0E0PIU6_ORYRU
MRRRGQEGWGEAVEVGDETRDAHRCLHASSGSAAFPKRRRALSLIGRRLQYPHQGRDGGGLVAAFARAIALPPLQPPPRKPSLATISIAEKKHGIRKEDAINILEVTPAHHPHHRGLFRAPSP